MSRPPSIAILWESSDAPQEHIVREVTLALQRQVSEHFAPVWGRGAEIRYVPLGHPLHADDWWLVVLDDVARGQARGFHELTWMGLPQATVYLDETRRDDRTGAFWSSAASHALLELLADPFSSLASCLLERTVTIPTGEAPTDVRIAEWRRIGRQFEMRAEQLEDEARQRIDAALIAHTTTVESLIADGTIQVSGLAPLFYAREVCDPCGPDGYRIGGVEVANFVHPAWFSRYGDGQIPGAGTADRESLLRGVFDHLGVLREPFQQLASVGVLDPGDGPSATWRLRAADGSDGGAVADHSRLWRRTVPLRPFSRPIAQPFYNSIWGSPPGGYPVAPNGGASS